MTKAEIKTTLEAKLSSLQAFAEENDLPTIVAVNDTYIIGGKATTLMGKICNIIDAVAEGSGERSSLFALTVAIAVTGNELRAGKPDAERTRAAVKYLRERLDIFSENFEE